MKKKYMTVTALPDLPLWDRSREKRIPLSFDLEVTARCNCACRHCYINLPASDETAEKKEMTVDEIARIADQAVGMGSLWCLVTGGEPLLRADFPNIYRLLKKKACWCRCSPMPAW